jgi:Transposase DDE domain group 1
MDEDNLLPFALPAICRKKVTIAFDGGRLSSDGGVLLLRGVEQHLGVAARVAGCLRDRRDPDRIDHEIAEMLRLRMFLIAAGYEDADDCDALRTDPVFKMAVGRLPESGAALCSQPTMSRLENAPSRIEIARMMAAMVDLFCASWRRPPQAITLDIDDTLDRVHGHQQLSLFNAHYDERCFLPIHIYEAATGKPVAVILRAGKTPGGAEVRAVIKHVVRRIRRH